MIINLRRLSTLCLLALAANSMAQVHPYHDVTHRSAVFGHDKTYRLYLPASYQNSQKRFPVIYFFHGWGGRYFKDDNAKLEYDSLQHLVDKYQVILVMWDGNIDPNQPRPYNVGNHEDIQYQVQFKDYFAELVAHVDSTYRTLTDRSHRGIIGFSMGGFMALYLGGEYADRVCAVVSFAGSPEFFVGYPDNHTLYPIRYTFKNLRDVNVRQHNGNTDILYYLNEEVHQGALWENGPYEYWQFKGGHMVDSPGKTDAFEKAVKFVADNFKEPHLPPTSWSHYELYDHFGLWGYDVASNKHEPGFLFLRNVDIHGFGFETHRWLPDGPPLSTVKAQVVTAPVYKPGITYQTVSLDASRQPHLDQQTSDRDGRLHFTVDGAGANTGIFTDKDAPEFVFLDYSVNDHGRYLRSNEKNSLAIRLFNRAGEKTSGNLTVHLRTTDGNVLVADSILDLKILPGQRVIALPELSVTCRKLPPLHAEPWQVKIYLRMENDGHHNNDELIVPVLFDVPAFTSTQVDDGRTVSDKTYGKGNGDGVINAGEQIMVYEGNHRLKIFTDDPYVISADEQQADEILPSVWPDGYTTTSVIAVSPDCPDGHVIEAMGSYETKTWNPIERQVHWGKVELVVKRNQ